MTLSVFFLLLCQTIAHPLPPWCGPILPDIKLQRYALQEGGRNFGFRVAQSQLGYFSCIVILPVRVSWVPEVSILGLGRC